MKIVWVLAFGTIFGFVKSIQAEEECLKLNLNCDECSKKDKCLFYTAYPQDVKGICVGKEPALEVFLEGLGAENVKNCSILPKFTIDSTDSSTNLPKITKNYSDLSKIASPSTTKKVTNSSTSTKTPKKEAATKVSRKSFSGGVFFGGMVLAIVLLIIIGFTANKYHSMKYGTPVLYGLLNPAPTTNREGYEEQ